MASNRALRGSSTAMPSSAPAPVVYQIDFTAVASGKRIASTKRRVRWRFGFANPEALAAGETGTACRGEEHDVTLVWSITSGKRLILADGQEVHYSSSRTGVFEHSWTMRGNHVLKVVAHASPPLSPTPGFRQYDFYVDGQTFFSFPKVYRLGLAPNDPRAVPSPSSPVRLADRGSNYGPGAARASSRRTTSGIASIEAPHNLDEEEAYLQEAIKNSLQENATGSPDSQNQKISEAGRALLMDFDEASVPTSAVGNYGFAAPPPQAGSMPALPPSTTNTANGYVGSAEADFFGAAVVPYAAPPGAQQQYPGAPPPPQQYGAPPAQQNPYGVPAAAGGQQNPYGAPTPVANPYGAPPPSEQQQQNPFGAPPAPVGQQNPYAPPAQQWGAAPQQYPAATPFDVPAPVDTAPTEISAQPQITPSTIGFGSPQPNFSSYQPAAPAFPPASNDFSARYGGSDQAFAGGAPTDQFAAQQQDQFAMPPQHDQEQAPASPPPAGPKLTMNSLAGHDSGNFGDNGANGGKPGSLADQLYAKFANMDHIDLMSKKDEKRENPFETGSIGGSQPLAELKKNQKPAAKQPVMRSQQPPAQPGAMVVSSNQTGNWGGYGGMMNQQQPQQGGMGMGGQQGGMGMGGQQPFGQQPSMMQQQPQYGQPPQQFVQQPPMMQQQPQYGQPSQQFGQQPPMMQQQPIGQQPQYGQPQQQFGQQQFGAPSQQQGFY